MATALISDHPLDTALEKIFRLYTLYNNMYFLHCVKANETGRYVSDYCWNAPYLSKLKLLKRHPGNNFDLQSTASVSAKLKLKRQKSNYLKHNVYT